MMTSNDEWMRIGGEKALQRSIPEIKEMVRDQRQSLSTLVCLLQNIKAIAFLKGENKKTTTYIFGP